jgi:hypothetical protein
MPCTSVTQLRRSLCSSPCRIPGGTSAPGPGSCSDQEGPLQGKLTDKDCKQRGALVTEWHDVRSTVLPKILKCWHFLRMGATSRLCHQTDSTQCAAHRLCQHASQQRQRVRPRCKMLVKPGTPGQRRCTTLTADVLLVVALCIGQSRVSGLLQPRLAPQAPGQAVELGGILRLGAGGSSTRGRLSKARRSHCNSMGQTPGQCSQCLSQCRKLRLQAHGFHCSIIWNQTTD